MEQRELVPFQAGIAAGAPAVMTAHILFPALDTELPATMSSLILTGLLRKKLGFDGLIITDCLEMKAVAERWGTAQAALAAVRAGANPRRITAVRTSATSFPDELYAIELAKAALEGFNITYRELNEQQDAETNKKIQLEAEIATEEAAIEHEKVGFIEKERALQSLQHEFNDYLQELRGKENEKNLATQKLHYLKEKETNLKEFLQKAEGQLKTIGDSIEYTQMQVGEEEANLLELQNKVESAKFDVEDKRRIFDEKRSGVDALRNRYQQIQRSQFDAEKKVAVADTSIQNLQRTIAQIQEEKAHRQAQLTQLAADKK